MPESLNYNGDRPSITGWPIVRSVEAPHIPLHTGRGSRPKESKTTTSFCRGILGTGWAGILNPNPLCTAEEYLASFRKRRGSE